VKDKYKTKEHLIRELKELRQQNDELKGWKEKYRSLVHASPDAVTVTDLDGRIIDVSWRTLELHGFQQKEDLLGRSAFDLIDPDDHDKARRNLEKTLENGYVRNIQYKMLKKDGSCFIGELYASLIMGILGRPKAFIATTRDITDRKKAEEALRKSEHFLVNVFESVQEGLMVLDTQLTIQRVNGVIKKWYEGNLPLVGKKCFEAYHHRSKPCRICPAIRCLKSGKMEKETIPGFVGSSVEWLELFSFPIRDEISHKVIGVVEFARDITERKRAEKELKKYQGQLEELVEERTAKLKEVNERLRKEIAERKQVEEALADSVSKLRKNESALEQKNIALKEIIAQIEIEKERIKNDIEANVRIVIFPILEMIRRDKTTFKMAKLLQYHLERLTSSYGSKIAKKSLMLTPREVEVCNMVKGGLASKEISYILNISYQTVEKHRKNIRHKLGISHRDINLASYLREF